MFQISQTMDLETLLKKYWYINITFGVHKSLIVLFSRVSLLLVMISLYIYQGVLHFSNNRLLTSLEEIVIGIYQFCGALSVIIPLALSVLWHKQMPEIQRKLRKIERFSKDKLKYKICFDEFSKEIVYTFSVVLIFHSVFGLVVVLWPSQRLDWITQLIYICLKTVRMIMDLETLFYLTLLRYFIGLIHKFIDIEYQTRATNMSFSSVQSTVDTLKGFKQFHYSIWDISIDINHCLGANLLIFMLQTYLDISYSAYWIFQYVRSLEYRFFAIRPTLHFLYAVIVSTIVVNVCHCCAGKVRMKDSKNYTRNFGIFDKIITIFFLFLEN